VVRGEEEIIDLEADLAGSGRPEPTSKSVTRSPSRIR